ncbi:MAG: hypothetical protein VX811_04640, partial [Pseudomonadota bacterium]|nr:hypothetical protein [Pseudomonadota bacterium]
QAAQTQSAQATQGAQVAQGAHEAQEVTQSQLGAQAHAASVTAMGMLDADGDGTIGAEADST